MSHEDTCMELALRMQSPRDIAILTTPTSSSKQRIPGEDNEYISDRLAEAYGGICFRCEKEGHWIEQCPCGCKPFEAQYEGKCPLCAVDENGNPVHGKNIQPGNVICTLKDRRVYVHLRCCLGEVVLSNSKRRRIEDAGPSLQEDIRKTARKLDLGDGAPKQPDPLAEILALIRGNETCSISVSAAAGSGKTYMVMEVAKDQQKEGKVCLVVTLNCAAKEELSARGFAEARTFHSVGLKALRKHEGSAGLIDDAKEDDEVSEAEVKRTKNSLILREMFPDAANASSGGRPLLHDLYKLYQPYVTAMVSLAKQCALGIEEEGCPNNEPPTTETIETSGWWAIEKTFRRGHLIERAFYDHPNRKTIEQKQKFCSEARRLLFGLKMARCVFEASILCATEGSVHIGGREVSSLGRAEHNNLVQLPVIDYDDMLYLPVLFKLDLNPLPEDIDWLFIDEAQDTSRIRLCMADRLLNPRAGGKRGRLFVVGDKMQGLYAGWGGADPDALDHLIQYFGCEQFSLPVNRRCPVSHVTLSNNVIERVNEEFEGKGGELMKPMEDADQGLVVRNVTFASHPPFHKELVIWQDRQQEASPSHTGGTRGKNTTVAVIARTNAPLVALWFAFASRGQACEMLGRDTLTREIKKVMRKACQVGSESLEDIEMDLCAYVAKREREMWRGDKQGNPDDSIKEQDVVSCLSVLIAELKRTVDAWSKSGLDALETLVERNFSPSTSPSSRPVPPDMQRRGGGGPALPCKVTLATVHKAKGLEWGRVYLLQPNDLPLSHVVAKGGWEARQELNCLYVALTRSTSDLLFLRHFSKREVGGYRQGVETLFESTPIKRAAPQMGHSAGFESGPQYRPAEDSWAYYQAAMNENRTSQDNGGAYKDAGGSSSAARDDDLRILSGHSGLEIPTVLVDDQLLSFIKAAYRKSALRFHPDKIPGLSNLSSQEQEEVNERWLRIERARAAALKIASAED